jgi:uncharacterized iron-regulated protein
MTRLFQWTLIGFVMIFLLSACVRKVPLPEWVSRIPATKDAVEPEEIFRLPDGKKISLDEFLAPLERARVVFVGESHDQVEHHQIEARILRELFDRGRDLAVGMEMFKRSQQPILDRWSQGLLTEEAFLREVDWETTWAMDYQLYKGILDEIKKRHIKLLGLNVERELTRKVGQNGIRNLSDLEKRSLPEIDLSDRAHRAYIRAVYKGHHGGHAKSFDYFYEAQSLWDEAMAEALSTFLRSPEGQAKTILVFAGSNHIAYGFGISKRLHRRIPLETETVILKEWKKEVNGDLAFSGASAPLADFIWITKPNPPEAKRPQIGVLLQKKEGTEGLWIERVIPDSPAEKAGLTAGDRLIAVEGKEITEVKDIHHALAEKGWGREVTFTVLRGTLRLEIRVQLPALKE